MYFSSFETNLSVHLLGYVSRHIRRLEKRKHWFNESMVAALKEIQEGTMTIYRTSQEYNILKSTLYDRVSGRVLHSVNAGH